MPGYDIDSLKKGKNAPGKTAETTDNAVPAAGVWKHPETGHEVITKAHPLFGNTQSEALARVGYVRERDAEKGEVKTIVEQVLESKVDNSEDVKGLAARLTQVENDAKLAEADRAELETLRAEKVAREKAEAEKVEVDKKAKADADAKAKADADAKAKADADAKAKADAAKKEKEGK